MDAASRSGGAARRVTKVRTAVEARWECGRGEQEQRGGGDAEGEEIRVSWVWGGEEIGGGVKESSRKREERACATGLGGRERTGEREKPRREVESTSIVRSDVDERGALDLMNKI